MPDKNVSISLGGTQHSMWMPGLPVLLVILLSVIAGVSVLQSGATALVTYSETNLLSYASLALFLIVCFFAANNDHVYFSLLVFVLLAFPSPVNDFFPGVFLGNPNEKGSAIFPFITHIDFYLLLGIGRAFVLGKKFRPLKGLFMPVVLIAMFLSIAINFFSYQFSQEQLLLLQGSYQFRYLVELLFLLSFYRLKDYSNVLLLGFIISVLFLFVEASVYSRSKGSPVLISGTLANNVYASIVSAIMLFFVVIRKKQKFSLTYRLLFYVLFAVGVYTVVATGARMAILAFAIVYLVYRYIDRERKFSVTQLFFVVSIFSLLYVAVSIAPKYLPKRYDPKTITDRVKIGTPDTDLNKFIEIAPSWETSSLITRLKLYSASLKMISEHPVAGIGVGRWNFLKDQYGFNIKVLIDSHNGYLSILSQYGLLGLPVLYFIYLYPLRVMFKRKNNKNTGFLVWLALINGFVAFSDLSNSATFKHQIYSLLVFIALGLMQLEQDQPSDSLEIQTINRE